ncbi:hypothetical protein HNR72_007990 [Streptomyces collinus]|uniref:Uncharacterized protein n=1 Tax=Streptomyces collinus TaxID=42684 RepID=A0AA89U2K7_STRCU|nr:hypothetical protein [Streptomyces collinus]MBB5816868.1 hypothetical protein [Streptomyces collinus]
MPDREGPGPARLTRAPPRPSGMRIRSPHARPTCWQPVGVDDRLPHCAWAGSTYVAAGGRRDLTGDDQLLLPVEAVTHMAGRRPPLKAEERLSGILLSTPINERPIQRATMSVRPLPTHAGPSAGSLLARPPLPGLRMGHKGCAGGGRCRCVGFVRGGPNLCVATLRALVWVVPRDSAVPQTQAVGMGQIGGRQPDLRCLDDGDVSRCGPALSPRADGLGARLELRTAAAGRASTPYRQSSCASRCPR